MWAKPLAFLRRHWHTLALSFLALILIGPVLLLHGLVFAMERLEPPLTGGCPLPLTQPNGRKLAVFRKTTPGAKLTLVFVHGTPASAAAFSSQWNHAFPGADLVAYDRPGFGASPGSLAASHLDYQTATLLRLVQTLKTSSVVLVGHSYGCPVALNAALEAPEKISGVVLMGACIGPQFEHPWPIQKVGHSPFLAWALPAPLRSSNEELLNLKRELIALDTRLPKLTRPLLFLHGTLDAQVPVENVGYVRERLHDLGKDALFEARVYPGWNHFIPWEQAATVNAEIKKFVEKTALH